LNQTTLDRSFETSIARTLGGCFSSPFFGAANSKRGGLERFGNGFAPEAFSYG
jgi:hypothetical protein